LQLDGDVDFIGKKALLKKREEGLQRRVQGLVFDETLPPEAALYHLWSIQGASEEIGGYEHAHYEDLDQGNDSMILTMVHDTAGYVSSVGFSPRLDTTLAVATLPIDMSNAGDRVVVQTPAGEFHATVSTMPFEGTLTTAHKGPNTKFKESIATSVDMPW